ncbi:MAG TPA: zinc ribbon domain-containing protein [Candidatus Ozemobacteraceae bacterium]|nr:zinc ribbon domain-containing protein [Candidatus Ozemobacteraceae bacterium]
MKKLVLFVCFCLFCTASAWAAYCSGCGAKLLDDVRFCSSCGTKVEVPEPAKKPVKPEPASPEQPKASEPDRTSVYRVKTDLYVYQRRGDEHDILKKNFLFKPRRYKIKAGSELRILEIVGDTLLVESVPGPDGKSQRGWVTEEELALRSTWAK